MRHGAEGLRSDIDETADGTIRPERVGGGQRVQAVRRELVQVDVVTDLASSSCLNERPGDEPTQVLPGSDACWPWRSSGARSLRCS